jgi:hypothetical protein
MLKFKVWVKIEAVDDENDFFEDASNFPVCVGEFASLEEADQAIVELTGKSSL